MKQHTFTASVFVYEDGTLAVLGDTLRGLAIETDNLLHMRDELLRITPILLRSNHGLTDDDIKRASLHLTFHKAPDDEPSMDQRPPKPFWEGSPPVLPMMYA